MKLELQTINWVIEVLFIVTPNRKSKYPSRWMIKIIFWFILTRYNFVRIKNSSACPAPSWILTLLIKN